MSESPDLPSALWGLAGDYSLWCICDNFFQSLLKRLGPCLLALLTPDAATPHYGASISREAGSLVPGPLLLSAHTEHLSVALYITMLPWGFVLSEEDTNKLGFEDNGCFSYPQEGCLVSYKEHPHPLFPFTLDFLEPVFLQTWMSGFGRFILVENGTVDTNPPSEPWFL